MSDTGPTDEPTENEHADGGDTTRVNIGLRRAYPFLATSHGADEIGRLGNFRVLRLLGSGGMGFVFEAEEVTLKRRVALKVLKPELAVEAENRERFLREARAAAAVESDHVVTIYHVAEAGLPYLAMQFLEGETLQSRIEKPPPITLRAALEIARQTAEGLAAAHAKGLVHRDIKPANLWLETVRGAECGTLCQETKALDGRPAESCPLPGTYQAYGRVKILDFGLARRSHGETSLTSTGFIVGTPNFMSPEQASGAEVDGRADLFSLGCVLYTVLVGHLPFQGSSAMAVMMALANKTPVAVNLINPAVPKEVGGLVTRLLEKNPDRRPGSAREVADALSALLGQISGSVELPPSSGAHQARQPRGGETVAPGRSDTLAPAPGPNGQTRPRPGRPGRGITRRVALVRGVGAAAVAALGYAAWRRYAYRPVVVGVLHSQSGTMAVSEKPVLDATLMAIEEVNAAGGVLGCPVRAVVADGQSNPDEFAAQAERLLGEEKVAALFGCWTSASRKAVREVLQRRPGLLFYPVQYEGLEQSQRVVYLGPCPNQQLIPAVDFLVDTLGKRRLFVVGSDYVFPRTANAIIRDRVEEKVRAGVPVKVVDSQFIPLGSDNVGPAIGWLMRTEPDAVVNTINGGTNVQFFRELRKAGVTPDKVPTLSVSITENEVQGLNPAAMAGDYIAASYFQTVDRPESREFLRRLRERYEPDPVATDPMAAAYTGVKLWAKAAEAAGSADPTAVANAVRGMEIDDVRGRTRVDPDNQHAWLPSWVGRVRADGQVDVVPGVGSAAPLPPVPYPPTRTREAWESFLKQLQFQWDGKWQAPDKK